MVEGVGDHGLEYMTGGTVVVIGKTGRNFAAGMSGGIAYVLDAEGTFSHNCNQEMVKLLPLDDPMDIEKVKLLLNEHLLSTDSPHARNILENFESYQTKFVKVLPKDYALMMKAIHDAKNKGLSHDEAVLTAFRFISKEV